MGGKGMKNLLMHQTPDLTFRNLYKRMSAHVYDRGPSGTADSGSPQRRELPHSSAVGLFRAVTHISWGA